MTKNKTKKKNIKRKWSEALKRRWEDWDFHSQGSSFICIWKVTKSSFRLPEMMNAIKNELNKTLKLDEEPRHQQPKWFKNWVGFVDKDRWFIAVITDMDSISRFSHFWCSLSHDFHCPRIIWTSTSFITKSDNFELQNVFFFVSAVSFRFDSFSFSPLQDTSPLLYYTREQLKSAILKLHREMMKKKEFTWVD